MVLEQKSEKIRFQNGETRFEFLPDGDIFEFTSGPFMINQFEGNPVDGSANNIYLRIHHDGEITAVPLLGRSSNSKLLKSENSLSFQGKVQEVAYCVTFLPGEGATWFWKVELTGEGSKAELIYGQDISVADKGGVLTNELYISQYLDHKVIEGEHGFVICSRQNQGQGGRFPYLQQGALNSKIIGYSTDEMQFFGRKYKENGIPEALSKGLENNNYQYELSYIALQTELMELHGKETVVFYGCFRQDHKDAVSELEYLDDIKTAYEKAIEATAQEKAEVLSGAPMKKEFGPMLSSDSLTKEEIETYFPERRLEEKDADMLLSFFTEDHRHVVLKEKELLVERPHGNIITTLVDEDKFEKPLITSTHYMYGFFNGQITIGNTNMNKFISVNRGLLNVQKNTGQRIYVKLDGIYRLLVLPAAFEMGFNYSKWYYKLNGDLLTITSFAAADATELILDIVSDQKRSYEFIITNQLVMGGNEFTDPVTMVEEASSLVFTPAEGSALKNMYPDISYKIMVSDSNYSYSDDRVFYEDGKTRNGTLLTLLAAGSSLGITVQGSLSGEQVMHNSNRTLVEEYQTYFAFYQKFLCNLTLDFSKMKEEAEGAERLDTMAWWYTHNALVHFAVPHGLEQSGGAAWGTRDVCQGPMEFFLITGHAALARNVMLQIFAHQFPESGEWPQWFMFDRYPYHADDCHGDVVFWPLKAIGDYMEATGDRSILEETVPYLGKTENVSVMSHIIKALDAIKERFLYDTALISYAGGDWDDTLQPANQALKEKLVSAWTQALAYQTLSILGKQLQDSGKAEGKEAIALAEKIGADFNQYLIKDGVIAGFAYLESKDSISYMLHPLDNETGIHYRLLPLTRSIICGLVDKKQANINMEVIDKQLACPDGVRLMDRPARYEGGISRYFMRAEQASNVGREISLQYVHAHIRYVQAMAAAGEPEKAWKGLLTILPAKIKDTVKNAGYRQSNAYFSSSEGAFSTRYEYQENFDLLKKGEIEVKGGWRIYSSGPGIYLARVIGDVLGIRRTMDGLELDPVLPECVSGLKVRFDVMDKELIIQYIASGKKGSGIELVAGGKDIKGTRLDHPYRAGGLLLGKEELEQVFSEGGKITVLY